jgi:hypothetical protein
MKLALITTIWKRPELTKIVLEYYKQFPNLELICVGSEGEKSKQLAKGWHYIEYLNYPVSNKHNQALLKAKELKVDGVILIGSDDLMSKELFNFYQTLKPTENVVHGFADSHIYDTETGNLHYYQPNKVIQSVGTGRFFSKKILNKVNWQLWSNDLNRRLDSNCTDNLKNLCIFEQIYKLSDVNGFFVDIKHSENITSMQVFKALPKIDKNIMAKKLGKKVVEEIEALQKPSEIVTETIFENNKMYKFVSNGKSKHMPAGAKYDITGEMANQFYKLGYGDISQ